MANEIIHCTGNIFIISVNERHSLLKINGSFAMNARIRNFFHEVIFSRFQTFLTKINSFVTPSPDLKGLKKSMASRCCLASFADLHMRWGCPAGEDSLSNQIF